MENQANQANQPDIPSKQNPPSLRKQKLIAVALSILPMVIYFILLMLFAMLSGILRLDYDKYFPAMNAISLAISAIIMCRVLKKRTGKRLSSALKIKPFNVCAVLLLLVFSWCAAEVAEGIVANLCSGFMSVKPNHSAGASLLGILEAVLAAPVLEEILIRFLGTEFAERYFPMPLLCAANAIYFALLHGYNIAGFVNVLVFGLCAAYVYLKTKRLFYTVMVHMLHNALCLIEYGDCIFFGSPIYRMENGFNLASWQWIVANFLIAAACVVIYQKNKQKNSQKRGEKNEL